MAHDGPWCFLGVCCNFLGKACLFGEAVGLSCVKPSLLVSAYQLTPNKKVAMTTLPHAAGYNLPWDPTCPSRLGL